eukprot:c25877_g1_i2 orf=469-1500(-)
MADPATVNRRGMEGNETTGGEGCNILPAESFTHGGVRKAKFEPKIPARRQKKPIAVKREPGDGGETTLPSEIMKLVKQSQEDANQARGGRRPDTKVPVRVAFGFGSAVGGRAAAGFHRGGVAGAGVSGADKKSSIKSLQGSAQDDMRLDEKTGKLKKKDTDEPWDYSKYYPITLPLRKPYSGRAEDLDDEEFGETAATSVPDEDAVPCAEELDLINERDEDRLIFFQIPSLLPLTKEAAFSNDGAPEGSSSGVRTELNGTHISLNNISAGQMGKLLVYRSGAVKLKLGDVILEAVPGSQCVFAQELVTINPVTKQCCFLGDVTQRVVIVPDVDNLLNSSNESG